MRFFATALALAKLAPAAALPEPEVDSCSLLMRSHMNSKALRTSSKEVICFVEGSDLHAVGCPLTLVVALERVLLLRSLPANLLLLDCLLTVTSNGCRRIIHLIPTIVRRVAFRISPIDSANSLLIWCFKLSVACCG